MALNSHFLLPNRFRSSFPPIRGVAGVPPISRSISPQTTPFPLRFSAHAAQSSGFPSVSALSSTATPETSSFTWDDAVRASQPEYAPGGSSDLSGFFEKIKFCNRGSEMRFEFVPFVIQENTVGYIHNRFVEHLKRFEEVFVIKDSSSHGAQFGYCVTLHDKLGTPEERTAAVGEVIKCLVEEQEDLIPGIRNELYPVTSSFGGRVYFSLERAAAPYFGIKAYGIHMNGFVESGDEKLLWVAKRSLVKPTYPGMLDHLVAGGLVCDYLFRSASLLIHSLDQSKSYYPHYVAESVHKFSWWQFQPHGISCQENVVKECEEEAGIPQSISVKALPVGAVSYVDIDGDRFKRDVLFCYDLKLPESFVPKNQDGEVEGFNLMPVGSVANIVRRTHFYKPNCSLVVIDFLFRHGYIYPESLGYLDLLQSLRSGNCS
ncbi:unnamed protein product [Linum tenue]|uniref:Nudix hydrolase domain-containing protein n=1 Tax=Linum tenue TaxID=586396 RepID=A0AAV0SB43_9ROSI|nr:unnamed protein product [Linum tenue]